MRLPDFRSNPSAPLVRFGFLIIMLILPLAFLHLYFADNWYSIGHSYTIAMLFGIVSYCLLCCTLVLSTRVHLLDRLFGHDKVLRFHGYCAVSGIFFGVTHFVLKSGFLEATTVQSTIGLLGLVVFATIMLITLALMTTGFFGTNSFLSTLHSKVFTRLKIDYSTLKIVHNGFSVALALIIVHVLLATSTRETTLRMFLMGLLGTVAIGRYLFHLILRPPINNQKGYRIVAVDALPGRIVRLSFTNTHSKPFDFIPGQFCYLRVLSPHTGREEHPFTLSSSPKNSTVQMTIKNLGNYTSKLTDLTTQTPIVLDGPYGTFTPLADNRRKVFVAGGIGITPFLSILSTWQELKQVPKTVLLWSVRTEAELIDAPLLKQMADRCTWFTFVPTVTNEQSSAYLHGRITPQLLTQTLVAGDPRTTDLYICGPTALIRLVQGSARSCGVQRQNIHFELFSF